MVEKNKILISTYSNKNSWIIKKKEGLMSLTAKNAGFSSGRKPKTNRSYRVCANTNCKTPLSIYNNKNFCFSHSPVSYPRVRGHIDRLQGEK